MFLLLTLLGKQQRRRQQRQSATRSYYSKTADLYKATESQGEKGERAWHGYEFRDGAIYRRRHRPRRVMRMDLCGAPYTIHPRTNDRETD